MTRQSSLPRGSTPGVGGCLTLGLGVPLGCSLPFFVIVIVTVVLVGGIGMGLAHLFDTGSHTSNTPPPIATPYSRPMEWLNLASTDGAKVGLPNPLAMGAIYLASDGQSFAERYYCSNHQTYGESCSTARPHTNIHAVGVGEGLMGLNTQDGLHPPQPANMNALSSWLSVSWNLSQGLTLLGQDVRGTLLKTGATHFHVSEQLPPHWTGNNQSPNNGDRYADALRSAVERYESGPTLGAWALASWQAKTGQWSDPGDQPETVVVVGAAPVGAHWAWTWSPPTETCTQPGTTPTGVGQAKGGTTAKPACHRVDHVLQGYTLQPPTFVSGTLATGQHVTFHAAAAPGGGTWFSASVPLAGSHKLTQLTALWTHGVSDTISWPEEGTVATSGIPSGPAMILTNQQALNQWWSEIQVAQKKTGTNPDLIASIMIHESGGNPIAYNALGPASGLMQILSSTAVGLPGYNPATWTQPQENLILGAELLHENYVDTGGVSWREAVAAYYAGLGTMEQWGFTPGMPWSEAAPLLNRIPAAWAGNTQTATSYAEEMKAEMTWVAGHVPKPRSPKSPSAKGGGHRPVPLP